jgi:hypothetical protein
VASPNDVKFLTNAVSPYDWLSPQVNTLWATAAGSINNPCPTGWHVPTGKVGGEWDILRAASGIIGPATAFSSALHLPTAGMRLGTTGALSSQGVHGYYHSSSPDPAASFSPYLGAYSAQSVSVTYSYYPIGDRDFGMSVRCIKN